MLASLGGVMWSLFHSLSYPRVHWSLTVAFNHAHIRHCDHALVCLSLGGHRLTQMQVASHSFLGYFLYHLTLTRVLTLPAPRSFYFSLMKLEFFEWWASNEYGYCTRCLDEKEIIEHRQLYLTGIRKRSWGLKTPFLLRVCMLYQNQGK